MREGWRGFNLRLLRLFLRAVPNENHRVFAVALTAGALCGLAAVSFHLAIIATEKQIIEPSVHANGHLWIWLTVLVPT